LNKDNVLFATLGILLGFIAGFLLQEVMAARQPPRRQTGETAAVDRAAPSSVQLPADAPGPAAQAPADAAAGGAPGQPPMAAILQLKSYVEQHPDDADAVLKLANLNFDIRNWARARELYTHYLELHPNQPDTMTDLGITYRELKQYDRALELFDRVQKVAPDHWQSKFNQVIVLAFDLKKYGEAESVLAELKRLQPTNPDVARLAAEVDRQKKAAA
jgi:tetratricopeptide (TPR) repeat protein